MLDLRFNTMLYASFNDSCLWDIKYASITVTEREMPARQCTKTPFFCSRPLSVTATHTRFKNIYGAMTVREHEQIPRAPILIRSIRVFYFPPYPGGGGGAPARNRREQNRLWIVFRSDNLVELFDEQSVKRFEYQLSDVRGGGFSHSFRRKCAPYEKIRRTVKICPEKARHRVTATTTTWLLRERRW